MVEEPHNSQVIKYRILDHIYDLSLLKHFVKASNTVTMYGELEIEPFTELSLQFRAEYWYLKYMLLRNDEVILDYNDYNAFYNEKDINVIWLSIKNESSSIIECKDGDWFVILSTKDEKNQSLLENYKLLKL